ncbi:MAG: oxygen-independent coproporphyrinogen III oxidase, partial [Firmicutes bacterium]|nr:oxygen-independent coproporphyrinogen III oxidase [Bacillota bacterium]
PEDKMSEWMFLGLRKTAGVSDTDFAEKFGRSFTEVYPDQIRQLVHDGLLEQKGDRLRLTRRGLDLANIVFEAFI